MHKKSAFVFVCHTHQTAEKAVKILRGSPGNLRELSIVGRDFPNPARNYSAASPDANHKRLMKLRSFWCRMWRQFERDAFLNVEGIGSVIVAGPLVDRVLESWVYPRELGAGSPLRAGIHAIGIPGENMEEIESVLRKGGFLVVAHGNKVEIQSAVSALGPYTGEQLLIKSA